jgi:hypothetical protein
VLHRFTTERKWVKARKTIPGFYATHPLILPPFPDNLGKPSHKHVPTILPTSSLIPIPSLNSHFPLPYCAFRTIPPPPPRSVSGGLRMISRWALGASLIPSDSSISVAAGGRREIGHPLMIPLTRRRRSDIKINYGISSSEFIRKTVVIFLSFFYLNITWFWHFSDARSWNMQWQFIFSSRFSSVECYFALPPHLPHTGY